MIQRGTKGNIMCTKIPGFSLILYYSTQCQYCQSLIPIFKTLPGTIGGCQFGMLNVSTNKSCVLMSKQTIVPIKFVPYIVLYINGKPFMAYDGPANGEEIRRFVIEAANNVKEKRQFTKGKVKEAEDDGIPKYTVGIPVCNGGVCYLDEEHAYVKKE